MSENKRSFWASVPGLVTGLAGLLTGIVGLITLLVQLDVIGGDKTKAVDTTVTTVAGSPTTVTGSVTTTPAGSFSVSPTKLAFTPTGPKELPITVRNTSATADLKLTAPSQTGTDKDRFDASLGDCASTLRANAVCTMKVTFTPSGPLKTYSAILQVNAQGAPTQQVEITASTLL